MSNTSSARSEAPETGDYPGVRDISGYQLTPLDFLYLGVGAEDAWACARRESPLGIPGSSYSYFLAELAEALYRENLLDADIRIQGSSVNFFSSLLKTCPWTSGELAQAFAKENGRMPNRQEVHEIRQRIDSQWGLERPVQRPFDFMYVVGISPDRSDIDVQISSDGAFNIIRAVAASRDIDTDRMRIKNLAYDFLDRAILDSEFLYLRRWASRWETILDRGVSIALFDGSGPPISDGLVSSHFKNSDWVVDVQAVGSAPEDAQP